MLIFWYQTKMRTGIIKMDTKRMRTGIIKYTGVPTFLVSSIHGFSMKDWCWNFVESCGGRVPMVVGRLGGVVR